MKNRSGIDGNAPESGERRKAIKKIAVGVGALAGYGALPERWTRPMVDLVVLPAHAQTSSPVSVVDVPAAPSAKKPISPCSMGISNQLSEDLTLIHDGTVYTLPPGNSFPDLTGLSTKNPSA